ncbi:hypothetical protein BH10ACT10_BH10ACT10_01840 [soil metagenome]
MLLKPGAKRAVWNAVFRVGRVLGQVAHHRVNTVHGYLALGQWSANMGGLPTDHVRREDLFAIGLSKVQGATRPLYLEFGVFAGASLRWWSEHLSTPGATLVGFDSFEGLPETWNALMPKGSFGGGGVPQIADDRVSFEVGWFDQTVPNFAVPEHDALVVNVDSDLYTSAMIVLDKMEPYLAAGSLLYFDELNDRDHELRALREFLARTGKTIQALGTADGRKGWLFEVS